MSISFDCGNCSLYCSTQGARPYEWRHQQMCPSCYGQYCRWRGKEYVVHEQQSCLFIQSLDCSLFRGEGEGAVARSVCLRSIFCYGDCACLPFWYQFFDFHSLSTWIHFSAKAPTAIPVVMIWLSLTVDEFPISTIPVQFTSSTIERDKFCGICRQMFFRYPVHGLFTGCKLWSDFSPWPLTSFIAS